MNLTKFATIVLMGSLLASPLTFFGQRLSNNNSEISLTKSDSIYASRLPFLTLPKGYESRSLWDLPSELDNAELPFFRSNFSQESFWNCGQCAGVGYNFTYEINVAKGVYADTSTNQYSPNFTFNFHAFGEGIGVNYFNSFDAIKKCGNPNLYEYGGLFNAGYTGWKTGYDFYENAMKNRITGVYAIDIGTPEGLLTLKQWLYDHLNGSEYGGVANFYLGGASMVHVLPPESQDAGFPVNIDFAYPATHAMTIVGFNDSVRYDINEDGQFTNDIDITNDGIVDMKDWEIGGLKYMNSWPYNEGRGYIMYRSLALEYGDGGIWNQQMHVIKVDPNYEPLATLRLKIKHDSRDKIKIVAGVSNDISDEYPRHTIDYPIFNFQGGDYYMQGNDSLEDYKTLELALDISPLYSFISNNEPTKFFVQIIENDVDNIGEGQILSYSIVDKAQGGMEIVCDKVPVDIIDNAITTLQIIHQPYFNKVNILNEELPPFAIGVQQTIGFEAEGGYPPYSWEIINKYSINPTNNSFPNIEDEKLIFDNDIDARVEVELPFDFPFYGDTVDKITVSIDGFILFDNEPYPYPFYVGEESMLKNKRAIAPFMSRLEIVPQTQNGVWVNKHNDYVGFRWNASAEYSSTGDVNFGVLLYADGRIETYYGKMDYSGGFQWCAGISSGDKTNYTINSVNNRIEDIAYNSFEYLPGPAQPAILNLTQDGLIDIQINNESDVYPVTIQVKDSKGITDDQTFNLSTNGLAISYEVNNTDDNNNIYYKDTTNLSIIIDNNSETTYSNALIKLKCFDEYLVLSDSIINIGTIQTGQSINIINASEISITSHAPDLYNTAVSCEFQSYEDSWSTEVRLTINAPKFKIIDTKIIDNEDQIIQPGETAIVQLIVQNIGHAKSFNAIANLSSTTNGLYIPFIEKPLPSLNIGSIDTLSFEVVATYNIAMGDIVQLYLDLYEGDILFSTIRKELRIGKIPVLIIDLDVNKRSGPYFRNLLNEFGLNNQYVNSLNYKLDNYLSVFVCLGGMFNGTVLSDIDSDYLRNYLLESGNLYMEGRKTWTSAEQTPVHEFFNIKSDIPYYYQLLDTIIGIDESYTKDLIFSVDDPDTYINYFIHPKENASYFFRTKISDTSGVVVAYQGGNYNTIGSSILFGTLVDGEFNNNKKEYLLRILDFFDIKKYIYVDIPEEMTIEMSNLALEIFPNPVHDDLTMKFYNPSASKSSYQIINIFGKLVKQEEVPFNLPHDSFITTWDCKDENGEKLAHGIYFIKYFSENYSITKKLIIN